MGFYFVVNVSRHSTVMTVKLCTTVYMQYLVCIVCVQYCKCYSINRFGQTLSQLKVYLIETLPRFACIWEMSSNSAVIPVLKYSILQVMIQLFLLHAHACKLHCVVHPVQNVQLSGTLYST